MDEFTRVENTFLDDVSYYTNLLKSIKEISTQIHNICFYPASGNFTKAQEKSKPTPKSSVLKQPVLQFPPLTEIKEKDHTAKRKNAELSSGKKPKREVVASPAPVNTQNKFEVLSNIQESDEAITSLPKVTEMETSDQTEITVTERPVQKRSQDLLRSLCWGMTISVTQTRKSNQ